MFRILVAIFALNCVVLRAFCAETEAFRPVAELLEQRCLRCHSAKARKGGLSLETWSDAQAGGENGSAIEPGKPEDSLILQYVTGDKPAMPKDGSRLTHAEVDKIEAWIRAGAHWPGGVRLKPQSVQNTDWWSFKPLARPAIPFSAGAELRNPVDAFIQAKVFESRLAPAPEADRRTLLRRLSFDLLGLPPTPADVARFLTDEQPDAYERLVDRQLASPHFGERWARHWLDVAHYGETHGYDKDKPRPNAWPYRDYVIRAFNEDKPYARFIREQIAGDALYPGTRDGIEALGFLAAGPWDFIGHAEVPETKIDGKIARHLDRDDMVATAIMTVNSLTVSCAQCHDHKFDPIKQEDYYGLQACFAALDRADRKYDADPQVAKERAALEAEQKVLTAEKVELDKHVARLAGEELAQLDRQIATASRPPEKAPAEHGYHSAIEAKQDQVKWVQIDLGKPISIERFTVIGCYDDFNRIGAGFGFPLRYKVELADDDAFRSNVQTLLDHTAHDVPNPGTAPQGQAVRAKPGRFLRITATRLAPRQNDFIFALAEASVFDSAGTNVALRSKVTALDSIEAPIRWGKQNLVDGIAPGAGLSATELAELKQQRETLINKLLTPEERQRLQEIGSRLSELARKVAALPAPRLVYAGMVYSGGGAFTGTGASGGKPRPVPILARGDVTRPGKEAEPMAPSVLAHLPGHFELPPEHSEGMRRAALANWLADPANSLTWRSIANRIWLYHFGRGIVESPNDFGRMGQLPSHPELLEWLAFKARGGENSESKSESTAGLKRLHRTIVTSATYRQSSQPTLSPDSRPLSPDFYAVYPRRRLDAEAVRDSLLFVAGRLDLQLGGPSFQDFVIERPEHSPHYEYHLHDPESLTSQRRSVYRFLVRSNTQPFMATLDCADPSLQVDKRNETITPLQALALMNNQLTLVMAKHFAERLAAHSHNPSEQVTLAFRLAFAREPTADELTVLADYLKQHGLANACRVILNLNEFVYVD
jgi:hypothetical protein